MSLKKIIKNPNSFPYPVDTIGTEISAFGQITIEPTMYGHWAAAMFDPSADAVTLRADINNGTVVVSDGVTDLIPARGIDYLSYPDTAFNVRFLSEPERSNGFVSKNEQEAIEEAQANPGPHTHEEGDISDHADRIVWNMSPHFNGVIRWMGWHIDTDTGLTLTSATPVTSAMKYFNSHIHIHVESAVGFPFTLRTTGTTVNEITGVFTTSDIEDIVISAATAEIQTNKSWINEPQVSIVEAGKSCTIDLHRLSYYDHGNRDFTVEGARLEFEPENPAWNITVEISKINNNGVFSVIDTVTFSNTDTIPRASDSEAGKYKRLDYNVSINGSDNEGVIVEMDQTGVRYIFFELKLGN